MLALIAEMKERQEDMKPGQQKMKAGQVERKAAREAKSGRISE